MDWKTIQEFEDYAVSSCGLVKSKDRFIVVKNKHNNKLKIKPIKSRILKVGLSGAGYEHVTLRKNNKGHNKRIHKLVAEHFCDGFKEGLVVHHKDGDKRNHDYSNLEFTTKQKNTRHYYKSIGKRCGRVPIDDIEKIISRVNNGEACYKIAREYGITRNDLATITKVIALTGEELTLTK